MAYITIIDDVWQYADSNEEHNNEKTWTDEEIHKVGKYYVVNRINGSRIIKGLAKRYRIWWDEDENDWTAQYKYYDTLNNGDYIVPNASRWKPFRHYRGDYLIETDLKPHIPRKQKKKVYGNAVIAWEDEDGSREVQLVQFHYKRDGCYYFKHKPVNIPEWKKVRFRVNADHQVEYKGIGYGWYCTRWVQVVSIEIY